MQISQNYFLLVNPSSGNGQDKDIKEMVLKFFENRGYRIEHAVSKSLEDYYFQISDAVSRGNRNIITLGGDGSLHHTVNAVMKLPENIRSEITLGLISAGTGNDWIKTHAIEKNIEAMINTILSNKVIKHDIGLMKQKNEEHYFVNIAGIGFSGFVVHQIGTSKNWGALTYYWGIAKGLFSYRNLLMDILIDGENKRGTNFMISIGIARYAGGGMLLCPNAIADDGLFDITLMGDLTFWEILTNLPKLKTGAFLNCPKVSSMRAKSIQIKRTKANTTLYCEADGEYYGGDDIELTILPQALQFFI